MKDTNEQKTTDKSNSEIMSENRSKKTNHSSTQMSTKTVISSEVTSDQQVTQCYSDGTGLRIDFLNNTIDRMQRIEEEMQNNAVKTTNQPTQTKSHIISVNFPADNTSSTQPHDAPNNMGQAPAMVPIHFRTTRIQQSDLTPEEQELYHRAELLNKNYNTQYGKMYSNICHQPNILQKLIRPLLKIFSHDITKNS